MGLLAILVQKTREDGFKQRLINRLPLFGLLFFVIGIAWVFVLPLEGQFRKTYFSENALLAHQAITHYRETEWQILRGYKNEVIDIVDHNLTEFERNKKLTELLELADLDVYTHKWHFTNGTYGGENLYVILNASRGPQNEAAVVVAPWIGMDGEFNIGGVSLGLGLSRFYQKFNSLHKNLIFVFPTDGKFALRKWVEAYHTNLQHTKGNIEGAVILDYEFRDDFFELVEIGVEGLNGQLPNLDLANVAVHCCFSEGAEPLMVGSRHDNPYTNPYPVVEGTLLDNTYKTRLTSLWNHILQQASAGIKTSYPSAMFSGWRIDAITLKAIRGNRNDITTLGRVCESTLKSVNNLLEHFHQSFFFYLMLSPRYFLSIASYLPPGILCANGYAMMSLYGTAKMPHIEISYITDAFFQLMILVGVLGASGYFYAIGDEFLVGVLTLITMWCMIRMLLGKKLVNRMIHILSLLFFGLALNTIATMNFSIALVVSILCAPLAFVSAERSLFINALLIGLSNPYTLLAVIAKYGTQTTVKQLIKEMCVSQTELHTWSWLIFTAIYLPVWVVAVCTCT